MEHVKELWYGQASEFDEDINNIYGYCRDTRDWSEEFLAILEKQFVHDQMCEYNNLQVPAEGIVVRVDRLEQCEAYKLKNFKFLEHETKLLDKGESDIETEESLDV